MPFYVRSGGAWVKSVPRVRSGGAWSADADQFYVRDSSLWKLIHPDPADVGDLLGVENLAVSGTPTHNSATITWTNPTQPTVTPTAVQVRLAALGAVWTEVDYPITTWVWSALDPSTTYVAQVRLIRRVDGIITDTSPTAHVEFTTTAAPVGAPAPDPGGTGGDTLFPIGIPIGGGGPGSGDPVGTSDGCWYEYEIEIVPLDSMGWITTGITGTFSGALSEFSYDLSLLDPTRVYRLCVRTACDTNADTIADTFGDWECGDPFPGLADWGAICGGINDSPAIVGLTAVADAVFRFPEFCLDAEGDSLVLTEAVSGVIVGKGPGFQSYFVDSTGESGVTPLAAQTVAPFYATMLAPIATLNTVLDVNGDWTLTTRFRALTSHSGSDGRVVVLASYGAFAANFKLTESATGWTPSATVLTAAGVETITGTEIPFDDTVTHTLTMRWDDDDEFQLWVDGVVDGTAVNVSATTIYETVTTTGVVTSNAAGVVNMQQLGWDRALTDIEIETFVPGPASYQELVEGQGASNYWELQTARAITEVEPDLIGVKDMVMLSGGVSLAGDGPFAGSDSVQFVEADTEGMQATGHTFDLQQDYSFSLFFKMATTSGANAMVVALAEGGLYVYIIRRNDRSGLTLQMGTPSDVTYLDFGAGRDIENDGTWHHIGVTRSYSATAADDIITVWLDGVQVGQDSRANLDWGEATALDTFGLANSAAFSLGVSGNMAHVSFAEGTVWGSTEMSAQEGFAG